MASCENRGCDAAVGAIHNNFLPPLARADAIALNLTMCYHASCDQMKRYGDVIKCNHNQPIGTPSRTFEGLTCDDHRGKHVSVDDHPDKNEVELRAGSQQHERIVSIEPDGSGTKFGLVVLDLPKAVVSNDEGDDTRR